MAATLPFAKAGGFTNVLRCSGRIPVLLTQLKCFAWRPPNDVTVVVTDDASTVVCWHPKQPVPYEFSRPLPPLEEDDSVLKVSGDVARRNILTRFTDQQVREELMRITHTTKHRWFPRPTRRSYFPKPVIDREYL